MDYKVEHNPKEPCWRVYEISTGRLISTEYGDHCDANERRYARERAQTIARTLAHKTGGTVIR